MIDIARSLEDSVRAQVKHFVLKVDFQGTKELSNELIKTKETFHCQLVDG